MPQQLLIIFPISYDLIFLVIIPFGKFLGRKDHCKFLSMSPLKLSALSSWWLFNQLARCNVGHELAWVWFFLSKHLLKSISSRNHRRVHLRRWGYHQASKFQYLSRALLLNLILPFVLLINWCLFHLFMYLFRWAISWGHVQRKSDRWLY